MSIWTHVAGVIRIDSMKCFYDDIEDEKAEFRILDEIVGKQCLFESSSDVWADAGKYPEKYLPCGAEGTLQKSIWINPKKSHVAAYTISVFGDLRDFDNVTEIVDWFQNTCKKIENIKNEREGMPALWVRNAVIIAECENGESKIAAYHSDEEDY